MSRGKSKKVRPQPHAIPAGAAHALPLVAIVGRPNVGKSTLFNRLTGTKLAIVEDVPGVTRDRHYAQAWALGREFVLIDTGGFDPESGDPMQSGISEHVKLALEECDLVVCVFDATSGPMPADREAVRLLRASGKPVIFAANKADSESKALSASSLYELGVEEIVPVSALHGRGFGELDERLVALLPPIPAEAEEAADLEMPRVAIVGRPNAGKSSLVNQLIGEDRQLVDDRPGTTVDSVDTLLDRGGQSLVLIDTAGMRRKRAVGSTGVEALSVYQAIRAIERAEVAVLMIDAHEGVGEQDAKIAGLVIDRGRALVIALNKVDLMDAAERKKARERVNDVLAFARWAPVVELSAKSGRGVQKLLDRVLEVRAEYEKRVSTAEVNRFFEEVLEHHPPPTMRNKSVRLYYVTQAQSRPPTFVVSTNDKSAIHFSYQRYVINQIRDRFGFTGVPIRVRYRNKNRRDDS